MNLRFDIGSMRLWMPGLLCCAMFALSACESSDGQGHGTDLGKVDAVEDTSVSEDPGSAPDTDPVEDTSSPGNDLGDDPGAPDVSEDIATDAGDDPDVGPTFPLEVGAVVPDFSLETSDGTTFRLSDHLGKKVLIATFPRQGTPVCTAQIKAIEARHDELAAFNLEAFGMSTDTVGSLTEWVDELPLVKVKLLSDSFVADVRLAGEVGSMFGIFDGSSMAFERSSLVIDETGVLIYKDVTGLFVAPDLNALVTFLEGLQPG
jgi:peroxiredoxin Q/BCP